MNNNILPSISYDTGWVDGYLTTSGDIGYDTNGDMTSPFCEVIPSTNYVVSFSYDLPSPHPGWTAVCFYDSSKSKIGNRIVSESSASLTPSSIVGNVPSGAAYIRVCSSNLADGTNVSASCVIDFVWYVDSEGNLTSDEIPPLLPQMEQPYPYALWRIEEELTNKLMPPKVDVGAFANATQLRKVSIPKSVKKIGRYAFRHTKLTSVTIARDCEYYPTSFPDNCTVKFYPD